MKIRVGSVNGVKVNAVKETLSKYPMFSGYSIDSTNVPSGVSDQPKTLEETVRGAMNRARAAFEDYDFGVGLESGLMHVPFSKSGFMDVCVCAIYDGEEFHLGLSQAWEAPKEITEYMLRDGLDMSQASVKAGYSSNPDLGAAEGLIGIMTKGRVSRKDYTVQAIMMALVHLEHQHS